MPKVGFKNLDAVYQELLRKLGAPKLTKQEFDLIGEFVLDQIRGYVRSGINPKTNRSLKKLTDEWKKRREELAKTNPTTDVFSPGRSNLNLTGQLMDRNNFSITSYVEEQRVIIEPIGDHKPYVGKSGKPLGKTISNKDLAKFQAEQGREFLVIGQKIGKLGRKLLQQIYRRKLNEVLRKK